MIFFGVFSAADASSTGGLSYSTSAWPIARATAAADGTQRSQQPANSAESQASSSGSSPGADATAAHVDIVDLQVERPLARELFSARFQGKQVVARLASSPKLWPHVAAEVSALTALQGIQGSDVPQLVQHSITTEGHMC
ncbi:hypothetical protein WJX74_010956 [Apatococcus lobatus]|uniref:Uncharacterized protein n=1 Tax=Apatococcus lobatus TaxID=904363 RepID=A0AAW1RYV9_9CHLO